MFNSVFVSVLIAHFSRTIAENHEGISRPEQIHLSCGGNEFEQIVVTWSTLAPAATPTVEYGIEEMNLTAVGTTRTFVDGGEEKRKQYIHRVLLEGLHPGKEYKYRCGNDEFWSIEYWFRTPPQSGWSPKVAIVGDMGSVNAISLPTLQLRTQQRYYDAVIHVGDIAYDLADENGRVGDIFMNQIQPVAAYTPYMVCPGNHEHHYNFSHFRERFTMPGSAENLYYSFNMGPVHFISVNTEAYWYLEYGLKLVVKQYYWLLDDLKEANKNRANRPWIVLYGHRPMYCSGLSNECQEDVPTRSGLRLFDDKKFGLEKLLNDYGVDVVFWGHQHYYERLFPIYDYQMRNGSDKTPYVDPKGPVHIISGSGGSDELIEPFEPFPESSSALRNLNYGYTEVTFLNSTHMHVKQIATDANNTVIDDLFIVKHKHEPYNLL